MVITEIESRFMEVTGLTHLDLSVSHFCKGDNQQQKTTQAEYKNWGFVCTPLWLVDEMIEPQMESLGLTSKTCDACCGCGQFSIRLLRKLYNKFKSQGVPESKLNIWVDKVFLAKNHYFTEFQFTNVAKLIYIFGVNINVYIGDTLNLKYSDDNESGLLFFDYKKKRWHNIPNLVEKITPYKDNLDELIRTFVGLEKKLMPTSEKKLMNPTSEKKLIPTSEKKVIKPKAPDKPKVIKPIEVKVDEMPVVIKEKPKPVSTKSKKVVEVIVEEPKIGGLYKPTIDFGEDL